MKKTIFLLLSSLTLFAIAFSGCKERNYEGKEEPLFRSVTIQLPDNVKASASGVARITPSVVANGVSPLSVSPASSLPTDTVSVRILAGDSAVFSGIAEEYDTALAASIDSGELNLSTNTVTLTLPMEAPLKLIALAYNQTVDKNSPVAVGMSSEFNIAPGETSLSLKIDMVKVPDTSTFVEGDLFETFNTTSLDIGHWYYKELETVREIRFDSVATTNGEFVSSVRAVNIEKDSTLSFADPSTANNISADVRIESIENNTISQDGVRAYIGGFFYNSGGNDVYAEISLEGTDSNYAVIQCSDVDCMNYAVLDWGNLSTTLNAIASHNLSLAFAANPQFVFGLDGVPVATINATNLPTNDGTPNSQWKFIGTGSRVSIGESGSVKAVFDNVSLDGGATIFENFDSGVFDLSKWEVGRKVREIRDGQLQLDVQYNPWPSENRVALSSIPAYSLVKQRISSDVTLLDRYGKETETSQAYAASLQLHYQPWSNFETGDMTDSFFAVIKLQDYGSGVFVKPAFQYCLNSDCSSGGELSATGDLTNGHPVTPGKHRLGVEYDQDGNQMLFSYDDIKGSVDLTNVTGFNPDNFVYARLLADVWGTPSENFLSAAFDNVEIGDAQLPLIAGELDADFNYTLYYNGTATPNDRAIDVVIDSNDRIVAAGGSFNGTDKDMTVWRFNPDGSLDTTFGTGGVFLHDGAAGGPGDDEAFSVTLDSEGNLLLAGVSFNGTDDDVVVWKLTPSGNLDTTFGGDVNLLDGTPDGFTVASNNVGSGWDDQVRSIAIDWKGNVVVSGKYYNSALTTPNYDMMVMRLTPTGNWDTTFGVGGMVLDNSASGGFDELVQGLRIDGAGNIVVAGSIDVNSTQNMTVWRLTPTGNLDASFGGGAGYVVCNTFPESSGGSITLDAKGNILIGGWFSDGAATSTMNLWRLTSTGNLDATFGDGGTKSFTSTEPLALSTVVGLAIDDKGRILATGYEVLEGPLFQMALWRLNADGTLDTTFGGGMGYVTETESVGADIGIMGAGLALDAYGRIVVVGFSYSPFTEENYLYLQRYK